MSTATMTQAKHEDPKTVYSERELRKQEETLEELRRETIPRLEAEVEDLEDRIRARRRRRVRHEAEELLQSVKKTAGGLTGEQPRHAERFAEHLEKARTALRLLDRAEELDADDEGS